MILVSKTHGVSKHADAEIERLERLLTDLRRIRDGQGPSDDELQTAPIIHEYEAQHRLVPALRGVILGHPLLGNTVGTTSDLWVVAPDNRWVRTLSRFYRLGEKNLPAGGDRD